MEIDCPRINFPHAIRDLFQFFIRAAKQELLNAGERKTLSLQDANCRELEKMTPSVTAPGAGFRSIQQSRAAVIVKGSRRKFTRSLAVGRLQSTFTAPGVERFGQLLNCPAIPHTQMISVTVLLSRWEITIICLRSRLGIPVGQEKSPTCKDALDRFVELR